MLTVYKASAGAGKTFRLALEYIKHVIISPERYRSTLAVTFTNKATEEMKTRIMAQLYGLSRGLKSSDKYMSVLLKELTERNAEAPFTDEAVTEDFIRRRATVALGKILHGYHDFRIETIDRFFQSVLRNLAREMDLTPNLRVEIAEKEMAGGAVDRWIERLGADDKGLLWILEYIRSNMDSEEKWDVIDSVKKFSMVLLDDEYKEIRDRLDASLSLLNVASYSKTLREIVTEADRWINDGAAALYALHTERGYMTEDFRQGGRGVAGFILAMQTTTASKVTMNTYVRNACDLNDVEADAWVTKKASAALREFCKRELKPMFCEYIKGVETRIRQSRSALTTLSHLPKLRMLHAIETEMRRHNREQNLFLLSDTQMLLAKMIGSNDAPFVFEKIGAQIKNIMIDEFQDTSLMQWRNFKVLLDDRIGQGYDCMIVGDVKQSIYRWRSGDWRLLNNISEEFGGDRVKNMSMVNNYRSARNVIAFNNAFFEHAIAHTSDNLREKGIDSTDLKRAYDSVRQYPGDRNPEGGYVEVALMHKDDYQMHTLCYVRDVIARLLRKGEKSIAVLTRNNSQIAQIAQYCMKDFADSDEEFLRSARFISQEAFRLNESRAVNIIVDALRAVCNADDELTKARLSVNYQSLVLGRHASQADMIENRILPDGFHDMMTEFQRMPLYELCERICCLFGLTEIESQRAYLCSFFDHVASFLQKNGGGVSEFIKHYDESMQKVCIENTSADGIRLLTIHKSKGLEFDNVIMPFCDWQHIREGESLIWSEPKEPPFSELAVIPLDYRKNGLLNTIYENHYWHEYLQYAVDNMNLLYVGMTRAKQNLYVITQSGQNDDRRGWLFGRIIENVAKDLQAEYIDNVMRFGTPPEDIVCENATQEDAYAEGGIGEDNVFDVKSENIYPQMVINRRPPLFVESTQSREFAMSEESEEHDKAQYIKLGTLLHQVLSAINTKADIDKEVIRLEMDGLLDGCDITPAGLRRALQRCFTNAHASEWFSGRWKLYNECTILSYDAASGMCSASRPDRVMTDGTTTIVVDFKLYSLRPEYFAQVRKYMACLRKMGHRNVKGYLWMLMSDRIEEVKGEN
ncbi:MAG: UvrD-helicase domain-containing protein [Prevotella sp.]|nr:UvrD-helicase domain-containing protein [Prevotella sp.]